MVAWQRTRCASQALQRCEAVYPPTYTHATTRPSMRWWHRTGRTSEQLAASDSAVRFHPIETTTDFGRVYDPNRTEGLSNETVATGDILGCLQAEITLAPDATTTLAFVCATFAD